MTNLVDRYKTKVSIYNIYPSFYLIHKDYKLDKKKIIDLGASNGRYLQFFGKGSCGVEYSNDRLEGVKNGYNIVFGDLNKPFDFFEGETFDFIFSSHVIEHLESPYLFLKNIRNFGGDNAKLILGYPIENSLVRIFDPYFAGHDGHIYSFSLNNIKELFKETGFEIEKIYYDIPLAGRFKLFNWIQKIVQLLPYWLVSRRSNALYIVARKK